MRCTFLGLAGAGLVALALAAALPAQAQTTLSIGIVDMGRISEEYQAIQQLTAQYQVFFKEQQAKFEDRAKTRMLDEAELKEYMDLSQFGAPTDANKQRLAALAQTSEAREKELTALDQKTRTDDEQKRYDELTTIAKARSAELKKLDEELSQAVTAKREEFVKVITDSENAAIKAVAEQKKLSVVLAKASVFNDPDNGVPVTAQTVLYGGTDITDDVLAKLNAAPAPASAPAAAPNKPAASTPVAPAKPK